MSKILIIEDEVAIADLEKDYLELSGFDVEVANDGLIGYQKADLMYRSNMRVTKDLRAH